MITAVKLQSKLLVIILLILGLTVPSSAADIDNPPPDFPATLNTNTPASYLSPEFQISGVVTIPGENWFYPAAAYNSLRKEYLIAAHNDIASAKTIYASIHDTNRNQLIRTYVTSYIDKDTIQPSVVYNRTENEYFLVWMFNESDDGYTYEIWGRIMAGDGSSMEDEFLIASEINRSMWSPKVAWNSYANEYFVVWNTFDISSGAPGFPKNIGGTRVTKDGSVINPGSPFNLGALYNPHQVDITYNIAKNEYMLVFVRSYSSATTGNDIYGLRVEADGSTVVPFPIENISKNQNAPAVSTNQQNRYIVIWQHEYSPTDNDIYAREMDANGGLLGSRITISNLPNDETNPDVIAKPGTQSKYLAAWQREVGTDLYEVRARYWSPGGELEDFDVAAFAFWGNKNPTLAFGDAGYLFAYEGDPPIGYQHIYGRYWLPETTYLPVVYR